MWGTGEPIRESLTGHRKYLCCVVENWAGRRQYSSYAAERSGVASYGALGHVPVSSFGNSGHSAVSASLTVQISKITKEKHVIHFRLVRQKHAKTHVNVDIKTVSELEIAPGRGGEEKFKVCCPPHTWFPGGATGWALLSAARNWWGADEVDPVPWL